MKKSILTTIALSLVGFATYAQTSAEHTVRVIAAPILELKMTSTADEVFNFNTAAKYETGIVNNAATELKVKSSKAWNVHVKGGGTHFTAQNNPTSNSTEIPVGKLSIGKTLFNPAVLGPIDPITLIAPVITPASYSPAVFVPLTNANSALPTASGIKGGNSEAGNTFKLDYKMDPGYINDDTYRMLVTYTISNQ